MIVPITGNVNFSITLDPSVWIFDDRKVKFEDAFKSDIEMPAEKEFIFSSADRFDREIFQATNDNRPISKAEEKEILQNSYVMLLEPFLKAAEVSENTVDATIVQTNGNQQNLTIEQLMHTYLLFSWKGKQLTEDGPVHLYFTDGSNKDNPIKYVSKIIIN